MRFLKIALLICIFNFSSNLLFSQTKKIAIENQQWLQYYNESKLNAYWTLMADTGFRWKEGFSESSQFVARASLGYSINDKLRVGGGFAYFGNYTNNVLSKFEYRPFQEISFKSQFKNIPLNQRLRIEDRFFKSVDDVKSQVLRFRYALSANFTLFNLSEQNSDSKFILKITDEVFFNAENKNDQSVFDQNRLMIIPTFQLNKNISIATTWNNQFSSTKTKGFYQYTSVFWLQIRQNLDFSKTISNPK